MYSCASDRQRNSVLSSEGCCIRHFQEAVFQLLDISLDSDIAFNVCFEVSDLRALANFRLMHIDNRG